MSFVRFLKAGRVIINRFIINQVKNITLSMYLFKVDK